MNSAQPTKAVDLNSSVRFVAEERALYGLLAEFEEHDQLLEAARRAFAEGYRSMDAFSPFPIEGLAEVRGMNSAWSPSSRCWAAR